MAWIDYLQHNQIILLFLIIALGFLFGRIKLWGFSFESSGILFVAMLFGNYGFTLNSDFQTMGLILFIYAIGLQAGPSIFNISRKQGMQLNMLVFIILTLGALVTFISAKIWELDMAMAIGLFAGAMTSTPGLAAAQETTQSALTSTGYGLAYPLGVIGVIIFVKLLPLIFRVNIKDEENAEVGDRQKKTQAVISQHVEISNESLAGKSLGKLHFARSTGTIVSRVMRGDEVLIPGADTQLQVGDVLRIVGTKAQIDVAASFVGRVSRKKFPDVKYFESRRFVVTNKEIIGKSIADLNLHALYNSNVTRIRRGGVEFTAEAGHKLNWGDRVRVAGDADHMNNIRTMFGDEMKKVEYGDIFAIVMGILLGISVGLVPFSIGHAISFNLGLTGGVLLAGLFLSNRGKVGPVVWQVPVPIIAFMRELGLTLFLAVVGIKAGSQVFNIIQTQGLKLILIGGLITILPMVAVTIFARLKYRLKLIELVGIISGGMTSTPGLAAGTSMTESQTPLILYATVYPFAMIMMMIWVKILAVF